MPRKVFTAGEILTAADVNTNLMDQAVMVFADSTARTAAIPSPIEGMVTYLKDTDAVEKFDGSNFVGVADPPAILQVVQTVKTDTFTTASLTYTAVTGLSVSITPSSATSKILVSAYLNVGSGGDFGAHTRMMRDATAIFLGDASSARVQASFSDTDDRNNLASGFPFFLDSPATTSSITYSIEMRAGAGNTAKLNSSGQDSDNARYGRVPSSITVMEVAG